MNHILNQAQMNNTPKKKQIQTKRQGKQQTLSSVAIRGTLPSLRSASVDILTAGMARGRVWSFDLQVIPLTFVLASGIVKQRFQMQSGALQIMSLLLACFEEFRFRGVRLTPKIYSSVNGNGTPPGPSGYFKVWIDDAILTTAAPTFTDAFARPTVDLPCDPRVQPDKRRELQWVADDDEDQDWVPCKGSPTTFVPFTVAVFAGPGNAPNTSAGTQTNAADSTSQVSLDGAARIEFRRLATV